MIYIILIAIILFVLIVIASIKEVRSAAIVDLDKEWRELISSEVYRQRSNKELLQIMYDNVEQIFTEHFFICDGLCLVSKHLNNLSSIEKNNLDTYLKKHLPKPKYGDFASKYSWDPHVIAPRLEWLQTQIDKL